MSPLIPDAIQRRIEEFAADGKTGQIALNIFDGQVMTADIKEHVQAHTKKIIDKETVAR